MSLPAPSLASVIQSGDWHRDVVVFCAVWSALHRPDLRGLGGASLRFVALAAHASITECVMVYQCPDVPFHRPATCMTMLEWEKFAAVCDPARMGARVCLACEPEFYESSADAWVRRYLKHSRGRISVWVVTAEDWLAHVLTLIQQANTVFPSPRLEEAPTTLTALSASGKTNTSPPTVESMSRGLDL